MNVDDQVIKDLASIRFNCMMLQNNVDQFPPTLGMMVKELPVEIHRYLEPIFKQRDRDLNGR